MCVIGTKVGKDSVKLINLPNMNALAQVIGVLKPENRKIGQHVLTVFAKVKVTHSIYPARPFRAV